MRDNMNSSKLTFSKWRWFLLISFLVFCTDSALVNTNSDRMWARVSWVLILVGAVYFIPKAKYRQSQCLYLILISIGILFSMLVNVGFDVNSIQRLVIIWMACAISLTVNYDDFMSYFIKFIRFLAIFSVLCVLFAPIIRILPFPDMNVGNGILYKNLLFTNVSLTSDRNFGPFWEPGAFQLYINWAVFYEVRNPHRFSVKDMLIFAICLLTTQSTAGFLIMGIILLFYLCSRFSKKQQGGSVIQTIILVLSIGLIVGFVFVSEELSGNIFNKLTAFQENSDEINSENVSTMSRIYSVPACISAIYSHPIFGVGIEGLKEITMNLYGIVSNTNSILGFMATFGVIPGTLYVLLFVKSAFKRNRNVVLNILTLIILLAMFSTENMTVSLMFWTLLFYESRLNIKQLEQVDSYDRCILLEK